MNTGYKERRESGMPWLGALPAHWKAAKLKYLAEVVNGATPDSSNDDYWDGDIVWITPSDLGKLDSAYVSDSKRKISEAGFKSCGTSMVPASTVIMTTRAPIGNSCITTVEAYFNQECKALVLREGDSTFMYYQLVGLRPYLEMLGSGSTFMELSTDKFKDFVFPVPPLSEQRIIAAYLDRKTAQLDKLIAEKQALLQKLYQQRQALIHEAVTQGLNAAAPRKSSGVAWIGDVPAHWEVKKLKYLFSNSLGGSTPDTSTEEFWNGDIPWVSPKDMKVPVVSTTQDYVTELAVKSSSTTLIPENSVLVVMRSGILKHTLPVAINAVQVTLNQDMKAFVPNEHISAEYLSHLLKGFQQHILNQCTKIGATVDSIETEWLYSFPLPVPPLVEQARIVDYLHNRNAHINEAAATIHTQIQTLKTYRQSLISEVVMGKVDVRTTPVTTAPA
jgi:type I restriction enzyme S subunit